MEIVNILKSLSSWFKIVEQFTVLLVFSSKKCAVRKPTLDSAVQKPTLDSCLLRFLSTVRIIVDSGIADNLRVTCI